MNTDRAFQALIGLLHDIGKFRQRARWGQERRPHEEQGADWVAQRLAPRLKFLSPEDRQRLASAIRDHHGSPYDRDARALIAADRLASGERAPREEEEPGDPAREPLRALLLALRLPESNAPSGGVRLGLRDSPASGRDRRGGGLEGDFPAAHRLHRPGLPPPLGGLRGGPGGPAPRHLGDARGGPDRPDGAAAPVHLVRPRGRLPRRARRQPLRSSADDRRPHGVPRRAPGRNPPTPGGKDPNGEFPEEPVALLIGGDLSGIQRFLYAISSEGAAKSLRGRSAYLALLADAAVEFLLRELDLPPTQVVYRSGGHFYLLAPSPPGTAFPSWPIASMRS
jgi:CRISPR-associated protein Csm1